MKDIFEMSNELNGKITLLAGKCDIVSIEVNTAMDVVKDLEEGPHKNKFLADRYLELVEELAKYGIIKKEWAD